MLLTSKSEFHVDVFDWWILGHMCVPGSKECWEILPPKRKTHNVGNYENVEQEVNRMTGVC